MIKTAAIIVAAGRGTRAGGQTPKQFQMLGATSVLQRTLNAFAGHPRISAIVIVLSADDDALFSETVQLPEIPTVTIVQGGATRGASVRAGLAAVQDADRVLIHDGARPLVSTALISEVIGALDSHDGAAPALAVTDALWEGTEGKVRAPHSRDGLFRAQTPQGFRVPSITAAYAAFFGEAADDVAVALAHGLDVAIVEGEESNLKITHAADFRRAETLLGLAMDIRVGNGFDVHRFGDGSSVILCGVEIPHGRALQGHSDADVGMHAVTDAIYGALGDGDIGQHFPPSDPQWKGAASSIFLRHAVTRASERGYSVSNVDCTLICEHPKIGPHATDMRKEMSRLMGLETDRVSVKATTSERLGFTGREEGIAALATVTLVKS